MCKPTLSQTFHRRAETELAPDRAADGRIEASPVPSGRRKCTNMRTIFDFSTESAEIADWLAERDEFEFSVPIVETSCRQLAVMVSEQLDGRGKVGLNPDAAKR